MKRMAGDEDEVVGVELVVEVVQVEVPLVAVDVGIGHVDVTRLVRPSRHTNYPLRHRPSSTLWAEPDSEPLCSLIVSTKYHHF